MNQNLYLSDEDDFTQKLNKVQISDLVLVSKKLHSNGSLEFVDSKIIKFVRLSARQCFLFRQ